MPEPSRADGPVFPTHPVKCCGGMTDDLKVHEEAAEAMIPLRKKGIQAHIEKHADATGEHVDVVLDPPSAEPGRF